MTNNDKNKVNLTNRKLFHSRTSAMTSHVAENSNSQIN